MSSILYPRRIPQCFGVGAPKICRLPNDRVSFKNFSDGTGRLKPVEMVKLTDKYPFLPSHFEKKGIQGNLANPMSSSIKDDSLVNKKCKNEGDEQNDHFICYNCHRAFDKFEDIQKHLVICLGLIEMCANVETSNILPMSMTKSRESRVYECSNCQKSFANLTGLKNHMKIHNGDRPYKCHECDKAFTLRSCLKTHLNTIHSNIRYPCTFPECNKVFKSQHYLKIHLKIHEGIKNFMCHECDKQFTDMQSMKLHMRIHTGVRPYLCNLCDKRFVQLNHLKTHIRLHTGEKPFICDVCHKQFRQLSNLIDHKRTHDVSKKRRNLQVLLLY